ncbi:diaminopimelate epimerase [Tichowtungia aerotolerans]|uniref:Diaminopimelate epimerase n=1 Tax=Tichowtungia aerotolerans TaxID=2697043 RepID=A0A6P1M7W5_9BACT|nr:diaminopimelate epimerase [Tichowtungia aerotolerans]QHI69967.1 diaminopimelate epimerase [Tichowtungia aerotolerans]
MKIKFWKMHGARNDFVLCDNRDGGFPVDDRGFIARIAERHSGIGAEGVILIEKSDRSDFYMHFFNPDGGEAEMCGNGARCAARLAFELGVSDRQMTIETAAGQIRAQVLKRGVRIWMTAPVGWNLNGSLDLDGRMLTYGFVNSGVPHAVMRTGDVQDVDVVGIGSAVRRHRDFAPEGANVNFMQIMPEGDILVRTYERGVEAETMACGTGVTACALVAAKNGWAELPVLVHTRSGDMLVVDGELTEDGARDVTLTGPSEHVFEGTIHYGEE